jgi:hypothetical protein
MARCSLGWCYPAGVVVGPVAAYLRDLQASARPETTLRSYATALLRWFRFLWATGVPAKDSSAHYLIAPSAIALTDGAARLSAQFAEISWTALFQIVDEDGPAEIIRRTRALELQDPDARRWTPGKLHDDATTAYCRFTSSEVG